MAQVLILFPSSITSVPSFFVNWGSAAAGPLFCTPEAPLESTHSLEFNSVTRPPDFILKCQKPARSFSCSSSLNTLNPGTQPRQLREKTVYFQIPLVPEEGLGAYGQ